MRFRRRLPAACWPLADQGVVSLGGFVVSLALARTLAPQEYGLYSLLFLAMLQLQVVTGSLLFYPLSVRGTVLSTDERANLFGTGLVLLLAICIPLSAVLATIFYTLDRPELIAPAIAWLILWQVQELLRRCLFAEMRHIGAIPGDAIRYLGQGAALLALAATGRLTLANALAVMAAASGLGIALQAFQVSLAFNRLTDWRRTTYQCWRIGSSSLGSNLLSTLSVQMFPWLLAVLGGTILAANFQASLNVVMVTNPVLIGLCNVIPQVVARDQRRGGAAQAWRASRGHMLLGAIPVFVYYALISAWPDAVLATLYGRSSPYLVLSMPARMMAAAAMIGFGVEMVNAYVHGLEEARLSLKINAVGLVTSILVGLPLTLAAGLNGSCVAIVAANIARSLAAYKVLTRVLTDARHRYA
jgi:O-antigen/teichoic acid export membrane protein